MADMGKFEQSKVKNGLHNLDWTSVRHRALSKHKHTHIYSGTYKHCVKSLHVFDYFISVSDEYFGHITVSKSLN